MRLPRDLSGQELIQLLKVFGYEPTRQSGSHVRLTTTRAGEHHLTVPLHSTLRVGTLSGIMGDVAAHFQMTRDAVVERLLRER